ncbi:hypothetical protein D0Z08_19640 [Nocardioides immobilis]|uniref:FAD-binding domain-containing protein n=1 Tax=Nocardioides immobilis TaxID=2049295 RepID=A0A417XYJ8_9ACTN|nr:FAD-dependent monooxygenase [Nocardioides immobilis]RHW25441.1 hypothetical protein D0Z08_19640 [Nocardioides immobilis]
MRTDVVIIGGGPTGIFAYELLRRSGVDVVLVGSFTDASIMPVESPCGPITLVPVFPTLPAPTYPPSTPTRQALQVRRSGSPAWIRAEPVADSSLVEMLLPDIDAAAMAVKQFGERALFDPLDQVQEKVRRAYRGRPTRRAGYIDGLSPYLAPMLEILAQRGGGVTAVRTWNPHDRLLELSGTTARLEYNKLVYASDPERLSEAIGTRVAIPRRAPAHFTTLATDARLVRNELVYDLSRDSPVFRAFVASEHVVVVQESLAYRGDAAAAPLQIADALGDLLGARLVRFGERLTYHSAYPIESMDAASKTALDDACGELGILRFGRNAAGRYVDLHELEWGELRAWALS